VIVNCGKCKVAMTNVAKRQNKGADLTTASDFRCPGCHHEVTVFRKGTRQQEDISRQMENQKDG
jgi:transposase-like protein